MEIVLYKTVLTTNICDGLDADSTVPAAAAGVVILEIEHVLVV